MTATDKKALIAVAKGERPADLILANARVINVFNGEIEEGNVAIYGINFDIDRATLKVGAEKVLIEMVKLMKNNPDLKIEIQGHTDNTGAADHNLDLSGRRAETVKKFLLAYGIEAPRMVVKGYGEEKPVATNDTEDGRAMNRRVELKKIN